MNTIYSLNMVLHPRKHKNDFKMNKPSNIECLTCHRIFKVSASRTPFFKHCSQRCRGGLLTDFDLLSQVNYSSFPMERLCSKCHKSLGMFTNYRWKKHSHFCYPCIKGTSTYKSPPRRKNGSRRCATCERFFKSPPFIFTCSTACADPFSRAVDPPSKFAILRFCSRCTRKLKYFFDKEWKKHPKTCSRCRLRIIQNKKRSEERHEQLAIQTRIFHDYLQIK